MYRRAVEYAAGMLPIVLAVLAIMQSPRTPTAPSVSDVGWIAGCWDFTGNNRHVAEQWMQVEGDTMIGMSRTVVGGKTTAWEFLMIRSGPKGLEYVAKPSGQAEAVFSAASASAAEVVFENPAHDFPTKIIYKRERDSMTASTEGPMNGQTRRIDFPYTKVECAR
jgi:Domain of unknown function (DUF6265)